jgi:RHS repeat-associated protein
MNTQVSLGVRLSAPSVLDNKYQYNGKELNEDFGLNWSDYGARMYDATLGRWNAVDPLADAYQAFTPYAYVLNNPIRLIDPNGMYSEDPTGSKSSTIATPDGIMGSSSHFESNGQAEGNASENQNRTRVTIGGVVVSDRPDDDNEAEQEKDFTAFYKYNAEELQKKGAPINIVLAMMDLALPGESVEGNLSSGISSEKASNTQYDPINFVKSIIKMGVYTPLGDGKNGNTIGIWLNAIYESSNSPSTNLKNIPKDILDAGGQYMTSNNISGKQLNYNKLSGQYYNIIKRLSESGLNIGNGTNGSVKVHTYIQKPGSQIWVVWKVPGA